MTNDSRSSDGRAADIDRRGFLTRVAGSALVVGAASPAVNLLAAFPAPAATPGSVFRPRFAESDAAVFAEARKHFLIPKGVTYCNTGTLGASPREVVDALVNGTRALETRLAAWAYDQPEGEPLTGYEPSLEIRTAVGAFINAKPDEIAITQNATMSMNFLANGLDLAPGDEVITTDQEHGGCISPWRLKAKRFGIVVKELRLDDGTKDGAEGVVKLFADAMTPKTKAVMFSHVVSGLGTRMPARELCAMIRDRGALGARRRRAGGRADPGGREGARLRRVRRQPAQMDDGAERNRLSLHSPRHPGPVLDDARQLALGRPRERRVPIHAVRHGRRARSRRSHRRAQVHRQDRHAAHRAMGRDAHQTLARRPGANSSGAHLVTRQIRVSRRRSRRFASKE